MTSTCQKCENEKECFEYGAFYGKVNQSGNQVNYSDIGTRTMLLCDSCARTEARTRNKILIACIMSIGLIPLCILSAFGNQNTPKDFIVPSLIAAVFLVPCYFLFRNLKKLPSQQDGELEVFKVLTEELSSKGYTVWTATNYHLHISKFVLSQKLDEGYQKIHKEKQFLASLPVITQDIDLESAVMQLKAIYEISPDGFPKDSHYSLAERVRQIGIIMNQQGGMSRMLQAHQLFSFTCNIGGAQRNLEILWDGIGQWRG